jgi:hypothetical protein
MSVKYIDGSTLSVHEEVYQGMYRTSREGVFAIKQIGKDFMGNERPAWMCVTMPGKYQPPQIAEIEKMIDEMSELSLVGKKKAKIIATKSAPSLPDPVEKLTESVAAMTLEKKKPKLILKKKA